MQFRSVVICDAHFQVAGSAFRLLDRVVRNTQYNYADSVRDAGGVDAIVTAMGFAEAAGDDKTAVNGSRILAKLMAAHTDEIVAKLNAGGADVEQMACLLASLSVQARAYFTFSSATPFYIHATTFHFVASVAGLACCNELRCTRRRRRVADPYPVD